MCGQEARQLIQRERGHLGSWELKVWGQVQPKKVQKDLSVRPNTRAECRIDLMPTCLRTFSSNGFPGILKEKDRVRCLPKGHLTLTEQGKGHGKKCCQ